MSEEDFTTEVDWTEVADFAVNAGVAIYTHSTGAGQISQLQSAMTEPITPGAEYEFIYTVTVNTGDIDRLMIPAPFSTRNVLLPRTVATHTVRFTAGDVPGDFVIAGISGINVGTMTIDNVSLKRVSPGNDRLSTTDADATWFKIDVHGASRLYIAGSANVVAVGGVTGVTTTQNIGVAAIGVPYDEGDPDLVPRVLALGPLAAAADEAYNHVVLGHRSVDRRRGRHNWAAVDEVDAGPGLFGLQGEAAANGLKNNWTYEIIQRNFDALVAAPRTNPTDPASGDFEAPIEGLASVWIAIAMVNDWAAGTFLTTQVKAMVRAVMYP